VLENCEAPLLGGKTGQNFHRQTVRNRATMDCGERAQNNNETTTMAAQE